MRDSESGPCEEPIEIENYVFRQIDGKQYLIPSTPQRPNQEQTSDGECCRIPI